MKSLVLISGHIVFPLKEGISAYIACSKGIIQTSKVVNIISFTKDFAHFETMNSEYKVTPEALLKRQRYCLSVHKIKNGCGNFPAPVFNGKRNENGFV